MPELPEVETVAHGLRKQICGQVIKSVTISDKKLRLGYPRGFCTNLEGQQIANVSRRAKYILIHLEAGSVILIHLGMTGRIFVTNELSAHPHYHTIFSLKDCRFLVFQDARRFGLVTLLSSEELRTCNMLSSLGSEPLEESFTEAALALLLQAQRRNIKSVLMDNNIVVGIGNIYANEILFDAKISPLKPARLLKPHENSALLLSIKSILNTAIQNRGTTLQDYVDSTNTKGGFQNFLCVYAREKLPCLNCLTPIQKVLISGRSTFFCPICQPH